MTALAPFVRIALYAISGWLFAHDPGTMEAIRHPDVVAAVTAGVATAWYAAAKWWGWST